MTCLNHNKPNEVVENGKGEKLSLDQLRQEVLSAASQFYEEQQALADSKLPLFDRVKKKVTLESETLVREKVGRFRAWYDRLPQNDY